MNYTLPEEAQRKEELKEKHKQGIYPLDCSEKVEEFRHNLNGADVIEVIAHHQATFLDVWHQVWRFYKKENELLFDVRDGDNNILMEPKYIYLRNYPIIEKPIFEIWVMYGVAFLPSEY